MTKLPIVKATDAAWWATHSSAGEGVSIRQFAADAIRGLPTPFSIEFERSADGESAAASFVFEGNKLVYLVGTTLDMGPCDPHLYNDATMLAPAIQGKGYGKRFARNLVGLAMAARLTSVRLHACMGGPYAWTRMGFVADEKDWPGVQAEVYRFIGLASDGLRPFEKEVLLAVAQDPYPRALRDVFVLRRKLVDCETEVFNGCTVARALLVEMAVEFNAELDLMNVEDMKAFWDYMKG